MRTTLRITLWALFVVLPAIPYSLGRTRFKASPTTAEVAAATAGSVSVTGQTAGPTPFIVNVLLQAAPPDSVASIRFSILPKAPSVTRPIAATYFADYLQQRGYLNTQTGVITIPVFGLYSNFSNTVNLSVCFKDGSSQQIGVNIITPPFSDPCGHDTPTIIQARTNTTALSYDFFLVRSACSATQGPFVLDSDGAIRWVGSIGQANISAGFFDNAIYMATKPAASPSPAPTPRLTAISRLELDGTYTQIADYAGLNVIGFHHNFDVGKRGILVAVDTTTQMEATILEIDLKGQILKTWNVDQIISNAGAPTFVQPSPTDWFHNNANAYRSSDNSLVISGREDFVMAVDYDTNAIKWILGDSTKKWYTFPSLANLALTLAPGTLPPIGEHAVSFAHDDNLLLFDNGKNSVSPSNTPAGTDRGYNSPRKYRLDLQAMPKVATEVWNYPVGQSINSQFCSSVYEDAPNNFLIDYAIISNIAPPQQFTELVGLSASGDKVFDYRYLASGCNTGYNSVPLHWENLVFTGPAESPLRITSITPNGADRIFGYPGIAGNTYQLEYKDALMDSTWLPLGMQTPACSASSQLTDVGVGNATRLYRVRQLPAPTPPPLNPVSVNDSVLGTGNNQWDYSAGWSYTVINPPSPNYFYDEHFSPNTGNTATLRFNGTQVKLYCLKESSAGNIGISLDGAAEVSPAPSLYSATKTGNTLIYTSPVLAPGSHTLVVRVVGSHEASSTSNTINVDRAEVFQ